MLKIFETLITILIVGLMCLSVGMAAGLIFGLNDQTRWLVSALACVIFFGVSYIPDLRKTAAMVPGRLDAVAERARSELP